MMNKASASLTAMEAFLKNPALIDGVHHFEKTMENAELLTRDLNQRVNPLMETFQQIADHTDRLVLNVNDEITPLVGDARQSFRSMDVAADRIRHAADTVADLSATAQPAVANLDQALANVADLTDANSKERQEMRNMLKELAEAARSIRVWSSYLERHPEAIIYGKGQSKRR